MIVGFSSYASGGGSAPVGYLTQAKSPDGTVRHPPPEVVRGNPDLVRCLIDAVPFERTYTSGVLSFAPGEVITPEMEQTIIDGFERTAYAGLSPERYSILWVRHLHAGHHELHFVTPRIELDSGKSLNIHPPGRVSQTLFDTFRSMVNAEYGLSDPDDPARAREGRVPHHVAKAQAEAKRKGKARKEDTREHLTALVREEVDAGRITDRQGVERYLSGMGYAFNRLGDEYVTVVHPETGEKLRLKGSLYSRDHFNAGETAAPQVRYGVADPQRAAALAAKLEPMVVARATFHHRRYGAPEQESGQQLAPEPRGELLRDYLTRHLGAGALHTESRPRRQRVRTANQGYEAGGQGRDRDGATLSRRVAAFGAELQRTGRRIAGAVAELNGAGQRLERAGRGVTASAAALDPWLERQWWEHYYGNDRGMER